MLNSFPQNSLRFTSNEEQPETVHYVQNVRLHIVLKASFAVNLPRPKITTFVFSELTLSFHL